MENDVDFEDALVLNGKSPKQKRTFIMDAVQQGLTAYNNGHSQHYNPYRNCEGKTVEFFDWIDGWQMGLENEIARARTTSNNK